MTSDMEGRIARVLVRSCHPEIPDARVEELVNLGVGRATAQQIITELQRDQVPTDPAPIVSLLVGPDGNGAIIREIFWLHDGEIEGRLTVDPDIAFEALQHLGENT